MSTQSVLSEATASIAQPAHVYTLYIRTTPEKLWNAITDPEATATYFFGTRVTSDWRPGSEIDYMNGDSNTPGIHGQIVEIDPPRKLVHTFKSFEPGEENDPPTRVTWEIEPCGDTCKVTLIHDGFTNETTTFRNTGAGWPMVLSALKTYLETGEGLEISQ